MTEVDGVVISPVAFSMLFRTCAGDARDAGSLAHYRLAGLLRMDGQGFLTPKP